jgi:hypothetical protein
VVAIISLVVAIIRLLDLEFDEVTWLSNLINY